jgi:hypothetical protein
MVLAAVAFGMAQTKPSRTVEAQEFIVRDYLGNVRAKLSMEG